MNVATRVMPYLRIENFLPAAVARGILLEMIGRHAEFRPRGQGMSGGPAFYRMATSLPPSPEFQRAFECIWPDLERQFEVDPGMPCIELLAQAYNEGGSFAKHSDADSGGPNWQRRLSGVYYLHAEPRTFDGGDLAVFDRKGRKHLVEPAHNSAVFFPRDLPHEVLPVTCRSRAFADSRFAINVWIS